MNNSAKNFKSLEGALKALGSPSKYKKRLYNLEISREKREKAAKIKHPRDIRQESANADLINRESRLKLHKNGSKI